MVVNIIKFALSGIILFYATVGVLFMHTAKPAYTGVTSCDKINKIDNQLWCMGRMYHEYDNVMLLRGENN